MKSRTFSGDGPQAIIKAVNDWLSGEAGVKVRRTETKEADDGGPMEFRVWYDQDGTPA